MTNPSSLVPLLFVHYGKSDQLELAIRQAKHTNPDSTVYLLGDDRNKYLAKLVQHLSYDDFKDADSQLKKIYKHLSSNSFEYEYFCFKRWFIVREFMDSMGLNWVCALDSDLLLFENMSSFMTRYLKGSNYVAGFCIPQQQYNDYLWYCSAHVSFISKAFVDSFCGFILDTYKNNLNSLEEKMAFHRKHGVSGGICDMTLLYLYQRSHSDQFLNLLIPIENKVFDIGIGSADNFSQGEFRERDGHKDVRFHSGFPCCRSNQTNQMLFFRVLHFQGATKKLIQKYYRAGFCVSLVREKLRMIYYKLKSLVNLLKIRLG